MKIQGHGSSEDFPTHNITYSEVTIMLMPMLWNSDNDLLDMRDPFEEMDRMMNRFWNGSSLETTAAMRTDVIDEGNDYKLEAELPGFDKGDINIDLKDNILTISASHKENKDEKDQNGKYLRRERRYSSYERTFNVGDGMKPEDINASYDNGVLTVIFPKKEAVEQHDDAKRIEIK